MNRWALAGSLCALAMVTTAGACGTSDSKTTAQQDAEAPPTTVTKPASADPATAQKTPDKAVAHAYFAGGCFWGVEHYMEMLPGVVDVVSGYMGGHVESPSYRQVVGKKTGHLETVKVTYKPAEVSFETVAKLFFEIHDPTQKNGQGPDIGPQYLSAVFYNDDSEKQTAHKLIGILEGKGLDIATELRKADKFWPAEQYHQNYYARKGTKPYCHKRVKRF